MSLWRSAPHLRRRGRALVVTALGTLALVAGAAPAAQASDLLVLDGETAELSGGNDFGFVYVDGELRLLGDTTINAGSVYLGPNARLRTCYVPGAGDTCAAGRSLTIRSASNLAIESAIDLTGRTGPNRPGGSLTLGGTDVAVGDQITTAGNGGASGSVTIESRGIATTGPITAYGAPVSISATRNVSVNGDLRTEGAAQVPGPAGRLQGGAPVSISSSSGDVAVRGNITTFGRDAGAGQGAGGIGADVSLSGGDVRVGAVDTTGGTSLEADAGGTGAIRLAARGALHALGRLDASGATTTNGGGPSGGATVTASAGGPAALAGGAAVGGGNSPLGGARAGRVEVDGASVALGNVTATGGNATGPRDGGAGGAVVVRSKGATSLGSVTASGGSVAASGQSISAGQISTAGGNSAGGPGADGGPVSLDADGGLALGGAITTSGTNAGGAVSPPRGGGSAGAILLRAAEGALDLGAAVWATGGRGGDNPTAGGKGGAGGNGGNVDVVARTLGTVVSIVADGGDGGDFGADQGPGGAGGTIHGFTDGPLLDDLKVVQADGGDGSPLGPSGARMQESSPSSLAIGPGGVLSWASRSPGASRFRVLRALGDGPLEAAGETGATSLALNAPLCTPIRATVVAVHDGVRWTSDQPAAASYTAQPSATQRCGDPAGIALKEQKLRRKLKTVRKAKWRINVALTPSGLGKLDATLQRGKKKVERLSTTAAQLKPGAPVVLRFALPKGKRKHGRFAVVLVVTSPDGTRKSTTTVPLEVLKK